MFSGGVAFRPLEDAVRRLIDAGQATYTTIREIQSALNSLDITLSDATPLVESGSGSPGTSSEASRADHVHPASGSGGPPLSDATPLVESGTGSAGVSTSASRGDHVHPAAPYVGPYPASNIPPADTLTGAVGVSDDYAREDHSHPMLDSGAWYTLALINFAAQTSQSLSVSSYVFDGYTIDIDTLTNCTAAIVNGTGLVVTGTGGGAIVFSATVRSTNFPAKFRQYNAGMQYEFAGHATYPWTSGTNESRISIGYLPSVTDVIGAGKVINAGSLQQRLLASQGGTLQFLNATQNADDTWFALVDNPTLVRAYSGVFGSDYPTSNVGTRGAVYRATYDLDWIPRASDYYGRLQYEGASATGTRATFVRCRFRVR